MNYGYMIAIGKITTLSNINKYESHERNVQPTTLPC